MFKYTLTIVLLYSFIFSIFLPCFSLSSSVIDAVVLALFKNEMLELVARFILWPLIHLSDRPIKIYVWETQACVRERECVCEKQGWREAAQLQ